MCAISRTLSRFLPNAGECPKFCAHLFLTDYCSFVNLHRFVKFASVQILASSPFRCRNVSESCSDQHHGRIAIRKCADYTGSASNLFHDPFQGIVRTQTCPMLIREVHIRQGFFNGRFDEFCDLIQVYCPEFFRRQVLLFTCSLLQAGIVDDSSLSSK